MNISAKETNKGFGTLNRVSESTKTLSDINQRLGLVLNKLNTLNKNSDEYHKLKTEYEQLIHEGFQVTINLE